MEFSFEMIYLFEQVAIEVADILEYQYPYEEANKVKDYLHKNKLNIFKELH